MTGGKTLGQVRAELEAAFGKGPTGKGEVAEALRRFLAAKPAPKRSRQRTAGSGRRPGDR